MIKKAFYFFAITGWFTSLIVVLLSLAQIDIAHHFPYVILLFVGIFIVWPPAIFKLQRDKKSIKESQSALGFIKTIFKYSPKWLIIATIASFLFANINGVLYFSSYKGLPDVENGQYILQERGALIKTLTEEEYHYHKAQQTSFFIGGGLLFYAASAAVLYPYPLRPKREKY